MAKATVRTKSGAVVTVEGDSAEVAVLIERLEGTAVTALRSPRESRGDQSSSDEVVGSGPTALVLRLRDSGFFDTPRALGEISQALQELGYLYPVTTLSGVALSLLKRGRLHRKKVAGKWVYGK